MLEAGKYDADCYIEAMKVFTYRKRGRSSIAALKDLLRPHLPVEGDAQFIAGDGKTVYFNGSKGFVDLIADCPFEIRGERVLWTVGVVGSCSPSTSADNSTGAGAVPLRDVF